MAYSKHWKVIPQFVLLNDLHENIGVFRVGAVQAEHLRIFVQLKFVQAERLRIFVQLKSVWEKMIMGITYTHIERSTGKW